MFTSVLRNCMTDQSIEAHNFLSKHVHVNCGQLVDHLCETLAYSNNQEWHFHLFDCFEESEDDSSELELIQPYEFYIVSDYFAHLLKKQGCILTDYFGFWIWGRTTTGQSIILDHVFQVAWQQHNS